MSADVIALDPVRLAGLETYLAGLADGCRRRAGNIGDELAGTDHAAPDAIALLERVAAWCAAEHRDVAWRRALIEGMGGDLPPTTLDLTGDALAADVARWGAELERVMAERPPTWSAIERVMVEVRRRMHSAEYAVALLRYIGPAVARQMAVRIDEAVRGAIGPRRTLSDEEAASFLAAQDTASRLLDIGTSVSVADGGLDDAWLARLLGLPPAGAAEGAGDDRLDPDVAAALDGAGFGLRLSAVAGRALGAGRAAPVLTAGGQLVGLVTVADDVADRFADDPLCAIGEGAAALGSAGLAVGGAVLAVDPPVALVAGAASLLLSAAQAWFASAACGDGPDEPRPAPSAPSNRSRTDDDGGGGPPTYGGGGVDSPHQDGPGGPLPPTMVPGR